MQPTTSVVAHGGIEGQLLDVFLYLGSAWILYLLFILSIISVAIAIERVVHFIRHSVDIGSFKHELSARLDADDIDGARKLLAGGRSHVGVVVRHGVDAIDRGPAAVEEVMEGAMKVERLKMERGLAFLGTLGNNAPFIGLFGTVLGIIRSFRDLATNTIEGSSAVMAGIAEALVATAVGLLVALPAVAVFNAFQRYIRTQVVASEAMTRILLAHAKSERKE